MMLDPTRTYRTRAARRNPSTGFAARMESVEPRLLFATFTVTTTADAGPGSFRQAILDANAAPNPADDVDFINFNIPGTGVHTITPLSPLPSVTDAVTIDASDTDLVTPTVELNGSSAGAGANGLTLASSDPVLASFVTGLIINRFSGNGIRITGDSNGVGLCYIGTNAAGTAAGAGNGANGILIESNNNFASDNIIAFNGANGVAVATGTGNDVGINSIFSNAGLGIDLGNNGRTANDAGDADTGANDLQNFPVITGATPAAAPATGMVVTGTVNSTPNTDLDIALYSSPNTDGEGQTFLDHFQVTTDASGNATFSRALSTSTATDVFTATATRLFVLPNGDSFAISTSEFSDPFPTSTTGGATIASVFVRGTAWAQPFKDFMAAAGQGDATYGFRADNLPADTTLPWINANQVVLHYSAAVSGAAIPSTGMILDGQVSDYTVTAVTQLDPQTVALTLDRALGIQPAGAPDPTLGDRVKLSVPNAAAGGGTYTLSLNPVQGDVDRAATHRVTAIDLGFVKARSGRATTDTGTTGATYTTFADVNGTGRIDAIDLGAVKARINDSLPAAAAAAGLFGAQRIADEVLA